MCVSLNSFSNGLFINLLCYRNRKDGDWLFSRNGYCDDYTTVRDVKGSGNIYLLTLRAVRA